MRLLFTFLWVPILCALVSAKGSRNLSPAKLPKVSKIPPDSSPDSDNHAAHFEAKSKKIAQDLSQMLQDNVLGLQTVMAQQVRRLADNQTPEQAKQCLKDLIDSFLGFLKASGLNFGGILDLARCVGVGVDPDGSDDSDDRKHQRSAG